MHLRPFHCLWRWPLLGVALWLSACASYAPPENLVGMSRADVVQRMGPPEMERRADAGSRLEFPRGRYGKQTWFIYFDTAGRATRAEQVLTEANFNLIVPGMSQDEVRQRLGRPGDEQLLLRERGVVWSYRYENYFCQWFQVEISKEREVRSAGYGQPPECDPPDRARR